jgi:citrate lyase beta subunit
LTDCALSQEVVTDLNLVSQLRGIMLPKVESAAVVSQMAAQLEKMHGPERSRDIIVTIETARGVVNAPQILGSCDNVVGAVFGPTDLSRNLDLPPSSTAQGLATARGQVVLAARAAGVAAIDGAFMIEDDLDGLQRDAETARRLGFDAKLTVFPGHLALVQEILAAERSDPTGSSRHPEGNRGAI